MIRILRPRRGITRLATVVLSVVVAVPLAVAVPAGPAAAAVPTSGCGNLYVLGARGSGQLQHGVRNQDSRDYDGGSGLGPQVYSATNSVIAKVNDRRSVVRQNLTYPAYPVPTRLADISGYFQGLAQGVTAARATLEQRARTCPYEHLVLAGYSQGAMVMHRIVQGLNRDGRTGILERLAGTILIADGDRMINDNTLRYGSAGQLFVGVGQYLRPVSGADPTLFPATLRSRIHSVCNARDVVCDFSGGLNATGLGTHKGYTDTEPLLRAARAVAASILALPAITATPAMVYPRAEPCASGPHLPNTVQLSGNGFLARERLYVDIGEISYIGDDLHADAKGRFSAGYPISSWPSGPAIVEIRGEQGSFSRTLITIGFTGCRSVRNGQLRMTGAGFAAHDTIALRLDGSATPAATSTSDEYGKYDFTTPCPRGRHSARVTDTHGREVGWQSFTC